MTKNKATDPDIPILEITGSRQFTSWLAEQYLSIVLTTYQAGKVFMIGLQSAGKLSIFERILNAAWVCLPQKVASI